MLVTCQIFGYISDSSIYVFIDDILKLNGLDQRTADRARQQLQQSNASLDSYLNPTGYYQAPHKEEVYAYLGNRAEQYRLSQQGFLHCRYLKDFKYLGAYIPNFNVERSQRIKAIHGNFAA